MGDVKQKKLNQAVNTGLTKGLRDVWKFENAKTNSNFQKDRESI